MDIQNIITLINSVSASNINNFQIEEGNFRLTMDKLSQRIETKGVQQSVIPVQEMQAIKSEPVMVQPVQQQVITPVVSEINMTETIPVQISANTKEVNSPIVGMYYSAPSPDKDDYVKVGDKVKKGQTLCIIEAMKLMNDIESDYDGEIIEILVKNEQMVEYNQPLFRIKVD